MQHDEMGEFSRVDAETGRVISHLDVLRSQATFQTAIGEPAFIVEGKVDAATFYYPEGVKRRRPALFRKLERSIAADGIDGVTFRVPLGTTVVWEHVGVVNGKTIPLKELVIEEVQNEADRTLVFTVIDAGVHRLRVVPPWPMQEQTILVTAHA